MGRTQQPLVIWVHPDYAPRPEVAALREKGHTIIHLDDVVPGHPADLILSPAAHAWDDGMWHLLEVALKAARGRRYPPRSRQPRGSGATAPP